MFFNFKLITDMSVASKNGLNTVVNRISNNVILKGLIN